MQESTKDKLEAAGAVALESIASIVPIIGTPLALGIGKQISAANDRRVQNQISELHQLLADAVAAGSIGIGALATDEFLANLHFTVRQLQETGNRDKRERLKHALVTGTRNKWKNDAEHFIRIAARLEEPHVEALSAFYEIANKKTSKILNGTVLVMKYVSAKGYQRSENYYRVLFEQIAAEGLIIISGESKPLNQVTGKVISQEEKAALKQGSSLRLTGTGLMFIRFLNEPLDQANTS